MRTVTMLENNMAPPFPGRRSVKEPTAYLSQANQHVYSMQDNLLHGRFLAEITKEVMVDLESSKYQHAEYRISIYGRKTVEWDILAAWVVQNKLASDNVVWLIQVHQIRPSGFGVAHQSS